MKSFADDAAGKTTTLPSGEEISLTDKYYLAVVGAEKNADGSYTITLEDGQTMDISPETAKFYADQEKQGKSPIMVFNHEAQAANDELYHQPDAQAQAANDEEYHQLKLG